MLNARQILVSGASLAALVVGLQGCGQRGPLYLPTGAEAANRATLPQLIIPGGAPGSTETSKPANAAASGNGQGQDTGTRKNTETTK